MSDLRHCPGCGLDRGGYYRPTPEDWQCDDCHARRIERGRQAVIEYATALDHDDPEDSIEHEQTAVDLVADILHYLDSIGSPDPHDVLLRAAHHYEAEHWGRIEENR